MEQEIKAAMSINFYLPRSEAAKNNDCLLFLGLNQDDQLLITPALAFTSWQAEVESALLRSWIIGHYFICAVHIAGEPSLYRANLKYVS